MTGAFFIALYLYTSSPKKAEKDGKLPASYHDLAALCISGVYHAVWKTGTDYLWPAFISARIHYGWQGIVILQVIGNLSFTALFLPDLFDGIDGRLIMASRDLGADPFHTLRFVILPAVRPGMLSVPVYAFHHESGRFWNTGGDRRKI